MFTWRRKNYELGFACTLGEGEIQNFVLEVVKMMVGMASCITHVLKEGKGGALGEYWVEVAS